MGDLLITIPARKGSKGVRNKNTRRLCGKKLLDWTCEFALDNFDCDIVLTTDIDSYTPPGGIYKLKRLPLLCDDRSLAHYVWKHACFEAQRHFHGNWQYHIYLEPTCPLREKEDVTRCLKAIEGNTRKSAFTVSHSPVKFQRMFCLTDNDTVIAGADDSEALFKNTPRQQLKGNSYFVKNGACYAKTASHLMTTNNHGS